MSIVDLNYAQRLQKVDGRFPALEKDVMLMSATFYLIFTIPYRVLFCFPQKSLIPNPLYS